MDTSSLHSRPQNQPLPPSPRSPTQYRPAPGSGRQPHYRSLFQDQVATPSAASLPAVPAVPPATSIPTSNSHQPYNNQGSYYAPFVPGLDSIADPLQSQSSLGQPTPDWQPDHLVRNCPICLNAFTLFYRRHHCRKCGRVVCAPCSSYRQTLPSSAVVRPPNEIPTIQSQENTAVQTSQWGGLLGVSSVGTPTSTGSNRYSWAGNLSTGEQSGIGFFDWRTSVDGMEDVRVCADCNKNTGAPIPARSDQGNISGTSSAGIYRTWNGAMPGYSHGRPTASDMWQSSAGVNTPNSNETNSRRRRQSLQGGRSFPYIYDPSTPPSRQYPSQGPGGYTLPPPGSQSIPSQPYPTNPASYPLPQHPQAKYGSYFGAPERFFALGASPASTASQHSSPPYPHHHQHGYNHPHGQSSRHAHPSRNQVQPTPVAAVKFKETDFCPICTIVLPPVGDNGDESARETHIQDCIRRHEASTSPRRQSVHAAVSEPAADSTGTSLGSTPGLGHVNMVEFLRQSGGAKVGARMVVYKAREEDTWDYSGGGDDNSSGDEGDENGENKGKGVSDESAEEGLSEGANEGLLPSKSTPVSPPPFPKGKDKQKVKKKAECVICFEEFEVGESIARLECLCRYHKSCIMEWFDRKGNGDCPIHAVRE